MAKKKKKMEFSKIAFICTTVLFGSVIAGSFALMWYTGTTDALPHLITSTAGLTTTSVGFYFWKAKVENVIKISKENDVSISEINDIDGKLNVDSCFTDSGEM